MRRQVLGVRGIDARRVDTDQPNAAGAKPVDQVRVQRCEIAVPDRGVWIAPGRDYQPLGVDGLEPYLQTHY